MRRESLRAAADDEEATEVARPGRRSFSSLPPSRMSTPRPVIWVETVTAPTAPASATIAASFVVVLGVEHDTTATPSVGEGGLARQLGLGFTLERADQDGAAGRVGDRGDLGDDQRLVAHPRAPRRRPGRAQSLRTLGSVRRDDRDLELVELAQLLADGHRGRPSCRRSMLVQREERLHRDGLQHLALGCRELQDLLLGLDGRLQPVRPAPPLRDPPAELVDELDRAPRARCSRRRGRSSASGVQGEVDGRVSVLDVAPRRRGRGRAPTRSWPPASPASTVVKATLRPSSTTS